MAVQPRLDRRHDTIGQPQDRQDQDQADHGAADHRLAAADEGVEQRRDDRGPDGWPEEEAEWISAQQLAARINWAMQVPQLLGKMPADPRAFAEAALGPRLSPALAQAVPRAETRAEAVALVLASVEFTRR